MSFKNVTEFVLNDNITYIGDYAFAYCDALTKINMPNDLSYIGKDIFQESNSINLNHDNNSFYLGSNNNPYLILMNIDNCSSYKLIKEVKFINDNCFYDNTDLITFDIEDNSSLISIGCNAFNGCSNLTDLYIPKSLSRVGEYAAMLMTNLNNIYYQGDYESWCNIDFKEDSSFGASNASLYFKENGEYKQVTDFVVPDSITHLNLEGLDGFSFNSFTYQKN